MPNRINNNLPLCSYILHIGYVDAVFWTNYRILVDKDSVTQFSMSVPETHTNIIKLLITAIKSAERFSCLSVVDMNIRMIGLLSHLSGRRRRFPTIYNFRVAN